jgi:SAM-dependent methyltransferase
MGVSVEIRACRLCGADLPGTALVALSRAPRGAQAFLDDDDAKSDTPISLELRACAACGLVQAYSDPIPNWQYVVRSSGYSPAMRDVRRRQFEALFGPDDRSGLRVLEAGSGPGDNLSILAESGVRAFGVEASPAAARACAARGLSVEATFPTQGRAFRDGPFDAFVTTNVLEHTVDPRDFLVGIRENLVEGAVGLVEVPSFERMVERGRVYDVIADHLSYFTSATLRLVLELSGFEVVEVSREWWPDDLTAIVRRREPPTFEGAQADLDRAVAAVRGFIDAYSGDGPVAVWGASHQALTLLALARATDVAYVIDSAPFKQGRLTPATHLPVVAPAHLSDDPPVAVLVMAAGYSDEVASILWTDHGYRGQIGVLRDGWVERLPAAGERRA